MTLMKKSFFIIIFSLTLFILGFFTTRPSLADCKVVPNPGVRCNLTNCMVGGSHYCCNSTTECDQQGGNVVPLVTTVPTQQNPASANSTSSNLQLCDGGIGIPTAIGCIPALGSQEQLFGFILKWAIGVGGGIAFLLIVYAGFMIMTSQGNPERLKAGQELLTAAISGVVLLVLSVFVLNAIGVTILKIPGFGQ